MARFVTLNTNNLKLLPSEVDPPLYDRRKLKAGIVHIGVGAFHRSHQAFYTDQLCRKGISNWSIHGAGLLKSDSSMKRWLGDQDNLYTLMVYHPDANIAPRVIGSLTGYIYAPDDPGALIEKLADPSTRIVSLTITEGGYNFDQSGEFRADDPSISHDLENSEKPVTVFGFLTESFRRRMERGLPAFTIQSCDNIQHNGDVAKKMILSYVSLRDGRLMQWIEKNAAFPNSMVDRITPVTKDENKKDLEEKFGIKDNCPVVCEPFCQWIIEDSFSNGRPAWEEAGAQFVTDVSPFEKMKIRLLNAGHSLLGFTGAVYGYSFIHEVVADKLFQAFLQNFMDNEVTPVLDKVPGIDLASYKKSLIERFGNPQIKDTVTRICSQSSAKIPKFLLSTVADRIRKGYPVSLSAFIIAAWCRCSEGLNEKGEYYDYDDDMKNVLCEAALRSREDNLAFLKIRTVFGDLLYSEVFKKFYLEALRNIYDEGIQSAVSKVMSVQ